MLSYIMSIRREPFEALMKGEKIHEFRRRFNAKNREFQVVFYVTTPIKAILAIATFDSPIYDSVDNLIVLAKRQKYRSEGGLRQYFANLKYGYALPLKTIKKVKPITLQEIRKGIPSFKPPQSYYYLNRKKHKFIIRRLKINDA